MSVVNTNVNASVAQSALVRNQRSLDTAMEQLSTGRKINSASDDAAGLAISTRMTSQINGLNVAIKNANDGIGMVNTAEGALIEITNMLQRMRELALQSANGTADSKDRTYLNQEYQALAAEIDRIADTTEWNGRAILNNTADGSSSSLVTLQVGVDTGQTMTVDFGDFRNQGQVYTTVAAASAASVTTSATAVTAFETATFAKFNASQNIQFKASAGGNTTFAYNGAAASIAAGTTASAQTTSSAVLTAVDTALDAISSQRATFGAVSNRLTHAVDNLTNIRINAEGTRSTILDTDYAQATSELAKTQIIAQAGTAMLAQANQLPVTVLALLQ
jgi:flagellin